jgi:hypothetical protein
MPLITEDIDEARLAFTNMEGRAQSAEFRAAILQNTVDKLNAQLPINAHLAGVLSQQTVQQAAVNSQLLAQQVTQISSDIPLINFISEIGMAAALGEATMPDRSIPFISTSLTCYHTLDGGIRFYQPEFGDPGGFGTTSFTIAKVPPAAGGAAPRSLYVVLEYAQAVFDDAFWAKFVQPGPPVTQPAQLIVTEVAQVLANAAGWSFPYLVQEAGTIASLATSLGNLLTEFAASQEQAFMGSVQALTGLVKALDPSVKPVPVVGDLLALTAALDAMVRIADTLRP